jgi:hypothetical protein
MLGWLRGCQSQSPRRLNHGNSHGSLVLSVPPSPSRPNTGNRKRVRPHSRRSRVDTRSSNRDTTSTDCEILLRHPVSGFVNHAVATDYFVPKKLFTTKHDVFHPQPRNENVSSCFAPSAAESNLDAPGASGRDIHTIFTSCSPNWNGRQKGESRFPIYPNSRQFMVAGTRGPRPTSPTGT